MTEEQQNENDEARRKNINQRIRAMQMEQQKRAAAKKYLTAEAYERLINVRMANYELYLQLQDLIIAMGQSNRITSKITEEQLKKMLQKFTFKPETKLEFRHK